MITVLPADEADLRRLDPEGWAQSGMILRENEQEYGHLLVSYEENTVVLGNTEAQDYAQADGLLRAVLYRALLQGKHRAVYRGEADRRWMLTYGFSEEGAQLSVTIEDVFSHGCHGAGAAAVQKKEK